MHWAAIMPVVCHGLAHPAPAFHYPPLQNMSDGHHAGHALRTCSLPPSLTSACMQAHCSPSPSESPLHWAHLIHPPPVTTHPHSHPPSPSQSSCLPGIHACQCSACLPPPPFITNQVRAHRATTMPVVHCACTYTCRQHIHACMHIHTHVHAFTRPEPTSPHCLPSTCTQACIHTQTVHLCMYACSYLPVQVLPPGRWRRSL